MTRTCRQRSHKEPLIADSAASKRRYALIDALRGFSLAGIVIVHMVENYVGALVPDGAMDATHQGIGDYVIDALNFLFLRGKFFALFSFLFGLSFYLQMQSAASTGRRYGVRFIWRMLILLGIGYVHALFYRGDILTIYAVLGILLIPFYRVANTWILALSAVLFLGFGRYLLFFFTQGSGVFVADALDPANPVIIAYFELLKNGSWVDVAMSNATQGQLMKLDFQLGIFSRGFLTFGFFLLGLYFGRTGLLQNHKTHRTLFKKILRWSIVLFVVSFVLMGIAFSLVGQPVSFDNWSAMLALTAMDINNLAMTFVIVSTFVLLFDKRKTARVLGSFAPYGRMALSNYVAQSIIGTSLFFGWGLGLLGELRNIYAFLIALAVVFLQMLLSKWWLRAHYYGPLEWLWRCATWFSKNPLKRVPGR